MPTSVPAQGHVVSFYEHDAVLAAQVSAYLAPGLAQGERGVLVVSAGHGATIGAELRRVGLDVDALRRAGRLVVRDAGKTLARILGDGVPDRARFRSTVLDLIDGEGPTTRLFGEMVSLLCASGAPSAAVHLEALWNELAVEEGFGLLCAYPLGVLQGTDLVSTTRICSSHAVVVEPGGYAGDVPALTGSVVFVPVPSAVAAARRFVTAWLIAAGEAELLGDAALVLSELATNSVRHAGSAFRVTVSHDGDVVRIGVEDVGTEPPRRRVTGPEALGGRGVAIIEDVASRWGCEATADGKRVWAELRCG